MTIASEVTKTTVQGNGVQTTFNYNFIIPRANEYELWFVDALGAVSLIAQNLYLVTGIGNSAGGTFTYSPAIANGTSLTLVRAVPYTQTANLINQGAYYPQAIETGGLDRIVMQIQQLRAEVDLAVRGPITDAVFDVLPSAEDRKGMFLYFNETTGQPETTAAVPSFSQLSRLEIVGDQSLLIEPTGNPLDTYASFSVVAETAEEDFREFIVNVGMVSNKGQTHYNVDPDGDKVALYVGAVAEAGSGDIWNTNTVTTLEAGSGTYNAYASEIDFNNLVAHRGDTPGAAGLAAPVFYGHALTGVAAFRSTAGFSVVGPVTGWNRGFLVAGSAVVQASFQDLGIAERSLDLQGGFDIGLSLEAGTYNVAPILLGNNTNICAEDSGGTVSAMIGYTTTDNVRVGNAVTTVEIGGAALVPEADNLLTLGTGALRWSTVYAATGTINTSDIRLKGNVQPLASMIELVRGVQPISFTWNVGGQDREAYTETVMIPATETVEYDHPITTVENGVARETVQRRQRKVRLYDDVPVIGPDGQQIVDMTKAVVGKDGRVITPAQSVPRVFRTPRLVATEVTRYRFVDRPGARRHYGFSAQEIKAAIDRLGLGDFGGHVVEPDGTQGLRPDQLIPILWRAIQELDERLSFIEPRALHVQYSGIHGIDGVS